MDTTLTPPYIGVDCTSRFGPTPRALDVCGIVPETEGCFNAWFWTWRWDPGAQPVDVSAIAAEIRRSRIVLIDAPQGLATRGTSQRACEGLARTPGKTKDTRPVGTANFAPYIASSIDLFAALHSAGVPLSDPSAAAWSGEIYPGDLWRSLVTGLPNKSTEEGNVGRRRLLEAIGVRLPSSPLTHDQLDAAIGAVAAAFDARVDGLRAELAGDPLEFDQEAGVLREGPLVRIAVTSSALTARLRDAARFEQQETSTDSTVGAEWLLDRLAELANAARPTLASYSWTHSRLFPGQPTDPQSAAVAVIKVAARTSKRNVAGLGPVSLDAFVVRASTRIPGSGHWSGAPYDSAQWRQMFVGAQLLHGDVVAPWEFTE